MVYMATFEVKNQLSKALRIVERGETVVITKRGIPIADIKPHQQRGKKTLFDVLRSCPHENLDTKRNSKSSREVDL